MVAKNGFISVLIIFMHCFVAELKSQIEKYLEGDADAIPSIFEAILKRKLAGKHDESDDEIMKEFTSSKVDKDVSDEDFSDIDFSDEDIDSD